MNYKNVYDSIIDKALERKLDVNTYYEKHHIIPKCLGGLDVNENLVYLTAREHYICHRLLIDIHKNNVENYTKVLQAFMPMRAKSKYHEERVTNSKMYEKVKNILYGDGGLLLGENHHWHGRKHTKETKKKMSRIAIAKCQTPHERKRLKTMALNRTPEHKKKIRDALVGRKTTEEARKKMSESHKGKQMNEKNGKSKKVIIDGKEYPSLREASRQLGINVHKLYYRVALSSSKKFSNYYWK